MSTAALMWTHNDADILEATIRHLLYEVDEVLVRHRPHHEEVTAILEGIAEDTDSLIVELDKGALGWDQSRIVTDLAQTALARGHRWVVACDPDEVWYANGARLADFLENVGNDALIVSADLHNHVCTPGDDQDAHPFQRMSWRERKPIPLPKVAARTDSELVIAVGNHTARIGSYTLTAGPWLVVRHFPYRSEEQFIDRVRSAHHELKVNRKSKHEGVHMWTYGDWLERGGEEALRDHFRRAFTFPDPEHDRRLIYDPAPVSSASPVT